MSRNQPQHCGYSYGFSFREENQRHSIQEPQQDAIRLSDELQPRIAQLGLATWQQQVYGLILARSYQTRTCGCHEHDTKQQALRRLEKLEHYERMALLKLAVWKGQCLSNPNVELKSYFDYSDWSRRGWKELKETFKDHSAMGTIVECIGPLLREKDEKIREHYYYDDEDDEDDEHEEEEEELSDSD